MKEFSTNALMKVVLIHDMDEGQPIFETEHVADWFASVCDVMYFTDETECAYFIKDHAFEIDVIVSQSTKGYKTFESLLFLPDWLKRSWFHFNDYDNHADFVYKTVIENQMRGYETPMFSVMIPVYNTNPEYLRACMFFVKEQRINDFEIILLDDSDEPHELAMKFAEDDMRIRYIRLKQTKGNIGLAKWEAFSQSRGKYLIELDHDDVLLPWCFEVLAKAIEKYPGCGFFYSDNADMDANFNPVKNQYGEGFACGFGFYYNAIAPRQNFLGQTINTCTSPNINASTIRHIVGVPNHVRCWERNTYFRIGGHNKTQRIADDYELLVRTFLDTRLCHIEFPLYVQRFDGNNSQDGGDSINRKEIQRRVYTISKYYNKQIHERLLELSGYDDGYEEDNPAASFINNNKPDIPFVNYVFDVKDTHVFEELKD